MRLAAQVWGSGLSDVVVRFMSFGVRIAFRVCGSQPRGFGVAVTSVTYEHLPIRYTLLAVRGSFPKRWAMM